MYFDHHKNADANSDAGLLCIMLAGTTKAESLVMVLE